MTTNLTVKSAQHVDHFRQAGTNRGSQFWYGGPVLAPDQNLCGNTITELRVPTQMIYHRGGEPERAMHYCHDTQAMDNNRLLSPSAVP